MSYSERLRVLKLPTLQYRRYRGDMIEMYKLSHGYYDEGATKNFMKFRSSHERDHVFRGHKFNIFKERCKKDIRRYSFKGRVTDQWNNLPDKIVESPSLNVFKNRLDKLWERKKVNYDPDIDLYEITSSRRTRYEVI